MFTESATVLCSQVSRWGMLSLLFSVVACTSQAPTNPGNEDDGTTDDPSTDGGSVRDTTRTPDGPTGSWPVTSAGVTASSTRGGDTVAATTDGDDSGNPEADNTDITTAEAEDTVSPEGDASSGDDGDTGDGGPIIISLLTNLAKMTEGETLVVSAVVTDPDGIDDLIGGQLTTPDGSATYGTFQSADEEGAYEIRLPWSELDEVQSIDFFLTNGERRTFRATFFDQNGRKATDMFTVHLHCEVDMACDAGCVAGECFPGLVPCPGDQRCEWDDGRFRCEDLGGGGPGRGVGEDCLGFDCAPGLVCEHYAIGCIDDLDDFCCVPVCDPSEDSPQQCSAVPGSKCEAFDDTFAPCWHRYGRCD